MANYLEEVDGKDFTDLVDNPDFQTDLIRFFKGARYGMNKDEIMELGPQGLAEKFVTHMRWQDTNEGTALKDYNYVLQRDLPEGETESFGNLMMAYDRADGGGTGMLSGAVDYLSAFATSPSTVATVATAGWGVGSKLAAKAGGKAIQLSLREAVSELVRKGVATSAIKDKLAGTVGKQAIKGAATSAVVEGAMGAGQASLQGETRQEAAGVDYNVGDLLYDGAIAATIGGTLGSAARAIDTKRQRKVVENLVKRDAATTAIQTVAKGNAEKTISSADKGVASAAADRAITTALSVESRITKKKLDPLDKTLVEKGNLIKRDILANTSGVDATSGITVGLSPETLKSITAATIDLTEKLGIKPNERITSAVAREISGSTGKIDSAYMADIRDKYNLTREQMSYVYLADLSEAGKTLAEASFIKRSDQRDVAVKAAKTQVDSVMSDITVLASHGIENLADKEFVERAANIYGSAGTIHKNLQDVDSMRIAFMTAQLGTTSANAVTSTLNVAIDMSDQFWKNLVGVTLGRQVGDTVQRNWVGGTLSTVKALSWSNAESRLFKEVFLDEQPEAYSKLFYETTRAETAAGSSSIFARTGRFFNILNSAVDSVYKQAALYSSVDRSLRELGREDLGKNLGEFLSKNTPLDKLPEDIMKNAVDDARRFTFQRGYAEDKSLFGKSAQSVIDMHRKLPFIVSGAAGIPFPRYVANHLEYATDYSFLGIATGGLNKFNKELWGDANKTGADRLARQMTGASIFLLGAYTAAQSGFNVDYEKVNTEVGQYDLSRVAGPFLVPLYLGDLFARWWADMPTGDVLKELATISLGKSDLSLDVDLLKEIKDSASKGEVTEGLAISLGNIAATFTYPITPARDFLGMIDPERPTTPYTRDVFVGNPDEVVSENNYLDDLLRRSTRFLPESGVVQYTQSFNGKSAIPLYSPDRSDPVGFFDPLSRQYGMQVSRRPNAFQEEMSRLKIRKFELFKRLDNPAVEVHVNKMLGENLPQMFEEWRSQVKLSGEYEGMTYDEVTNWKDKEKLFRQFVGDKVSSAKAMAEDEFNRLLTDKKRTAAGFIRNLYIVQEKELDPKDSGLFDRAVQIFTKGDYKDSADYLGASESVEQELSRRQEILKWAREMGDIYEGYPTTEFK